MFKVGLLCHLLCLLMFHVHDIVITISIILCLYVVCLKHMQHTVASYPTPIILYTQVILSVLLGYVIYCNN